MILLSYRMLSTPQIHQERIFKNYVIYKSLTKTPHKKPNNNKKNNNNEMIGFK